jgi:chromosome segregation ATPase
MPEKLSSHSQCSSDLSTEIHVLHDAIARLQGEVKFLYAKLDESCRQMGALVVSNESLKARIATAQAATEANTAAARDGTAAVLYNAREVTHNSAEVERNTVAVYQNIEAVKENTRTLRETLG